MKVPATVYVLPFHKYGSLFVQTLTDVKLVSNGVTVKLSVATVSQPPVVLANVSMKRPATVYVLPFHKYGNLFAQTLTDVELVKNGVTVKLSVATVSQPPVVLINVSMKVPYAVYVLPFHKYGSLFAQTLTDVELVNNGVTVSTNVATVSQPPVVLINVSMKVPDSVYVLPFHTYGSLFAQTLTDVKLVSNGVTVKLSVATVSQPPVVLVNVSMKVPDAVYVLPFHKYGSLFAQTLTDVELVNKGVTVKLSVATVSQPPVVLDNVSMKVPDAV
jgi:rRNA maturation protein Rpf1